jgi:hypothetical protein
VTGLQPELALDGRAPTHMQAFETWVHTATGGAVANLFIRLAIGCNRRGMKVGAKAIWERLRWHYGVRKEAAERYALNNNYVAYMARFAMDRAEELKGYFDLREAGRGRVTEETVVIRRKFAN